MNLYNWITDLINSKEKKEMDNSIPVNKEQHARLLATLLIRIQSRIVTIKTADPSTLAVTADNNLKDISIIGILKLREFCTFIIEQDLIKERDIMPLLNEFVTFQQELTELTKEEIINIYAEIQEKAETEIKSLDGMLANLKPDEIVH